MMFAFTSPGSKIDNKYNNGGGPPNLRIQGQSCHELVVFYHKLDNSQSLLSYIFMILKMRYTIEFNLLGTIH